MTPLFPVRTEGLMFAPKAKYRTTACAALSLFVLSSRAAVRKFCATGFAVVADAAAGGVVAGIAAAAAAAASVAVVVVR